MTEVVPFKVIIPVRLDSTRLPRKALQDINGEPMIQHVYRRAIESCAETVVIATDSEEIADVAQGFGADVCMTSTDHVSGTDRIAEAVVALGYDEDDIVVNLQGDEPLMPPNLIQQVATDLSRHDHLQLTTLCEPIVNPQDLFNPDAVKVVLSKRGFALYFSRAPIPWDRNTFDAQNAKDALISDHHFKHIGIYAYRCRFLQQYLEWEQSPLGRLESLEQLRVLWNGQRIHCSIANEVLPTDVNTPEDLEEARKVLAEKGYTTT